MRIVSMDSTIQHAQTLVYPAVQVGRVTLTFSHFYASPFMKWSISLQAKSFRAEYRDPNAKPSGLRSGICFDSKSSSLLETSK